MTTAGYTQIADSYKYFNCNKFLIEIKELLSVVSADTGQSV
jgi:hypothetical protein